MTNTLTPGDKVRIISSPIVENDVYGQIRINCTVGKEGVIVQVFENGVRNIYVNLGYACNYYSVENLRKI